MPIEVCTIGGFSGTGRNSTAIRVDDEVVILDMGLHMENYIQHTEDREDITHKTYEELLTVDAVPDYSCIEEWKGKVKAIVPSHGHLDHIGAIPFGAHLFPKAPVISAPYTIEVLKGIFRDEKIKIPNKLIPLHANSSYQISDKLTIELVHVTHSIPHTSIVVIHTPYGKVVYANDYKFDRYPTLGKKPNFQRLRQIGKEGVALLIIECLYADHYKKTPSESVAKQMLKDVMLGVNATGRAMFVTTFSSHLARLKSIIELGKKLDRKIVFLGRSLDKYVKAGERLRIINFTNDIKLIKQREAIQKALRQIQNTGKGNYLIVCTGHQGEPRAILSRLVRHELDFRFEPGDLVIFSCSVIPVELNQKNREVLEKGLIAKGVRIFRDIHVSGHGAREDHRDLIEFVKPQHIIPSHGGYEKAQHIASLAEEMGIAKEKIHLMENGKKVIVG